MKVTMKALISQREAKNKFGTPIDTLESDYVYLFESMGIQLFPVSNFHDDTKIKIKAEDYDLLILTGGGSILTRYYDEPFIDDDIQLSRDKTEQLLIKEASAKNLPMVGICRGAQLLNGVYGGKISQLKDLKVLRPPTQDHPVRLGEKIVWVNSLHNDGIWMKNLAEGFLPIAIDEENQVVEAFHSQEHKILGFQWHPDKKFKYEEGYNETITLLKQFIFNDGKIDESYYI